MDHKHWCGTLGTSEARLCDCGVDRQAKYKDSRDDDGRNRYVYYMVDDTGNIKIGVSVNPDKRAAQAKTDNPTIELLACESGGYDLEQKRHAQFQEYHIYREWFRAGRKLRLHLSRLRPILKDSLFA